MQYFQAAVKRLFLIFRDVLLVRVTLNKLKNFYLRQGRGKRRLQRAARPVSKDTWQHLKAKQSERKSKMRGRNMTAQKKDDAIKLWHYREEMEAEEGDGWTEGGWNKIEISGKKCFQKMLNGKWAVRKQKMETRSNRRREKEAEIWVGGHQCTSLKWWNITLG